MSGDPELEALKIDRPRRRPRRSGPSLFSFVLLVLLASGVLAAIVGKDRMAGLLGDFSTPLVRTVKATRQSEMSVAAVQGMAANGHVVAARRAALSADTPGRIVELLVTEGTRVKEGDLVARLYDEEFAAALARALAELESAKAEVVRAHSGIQAAEKDLARRRAVTKAYRAASRASAAEANLAKLEHERVETLLNKRAVEQRELDRAASAHLKARATVEQFEAQVEGGVAEEEHGKALITSAQADETATLARVEVAKATVEQARATFRKTEIRAPFTGVVVLKDAEVGEVVSPNVTGGSNSRGSIVTMVDQTSLEVQADVAETNITSVRIDGAAKIFLDANPSRAYPGRVARIWPTANRQKATIEVRVAFLETGDLLRPDMGVRVVFIPEGFVEEGTVVGSHVNGDDASPPAMLIAEAALVRRDGKSGVFVLDGDRVRFRSVEVGVSRSGRVELKTGVEEGETLIVDPPDSLEGGARVRVGEM